MWSVKCQSLRDAVMTSKLEFQWIFWLTALVKIVFSVSGCSPSPSLLVLCIIPCLVPLLPLPRSLPSYSSPCWSNCPPIWWPGSVNVTNSPWHMCVCVCINICNIMALCYLGKKNKPVTSNKLPCSWVPKWGGWVKRQLKTVVSKLCVQIM